MPAYSRAELESAFLNFEATARQASEVGDWNVWANLFTEDATYWEHLYGRFNGRAEIAAWITSTMTTYPGNQMPYFPSDWHVVDDGNGRVVAYIQNRMRDPGDGSIHEAPNVTILHYAGSDQWSYEEDIYDVDDFAKMLTGWEQRVRDLGGDPRSAPPS
jgi:hypothetical protein